MSQNNFANLRVVGLEYDLPENRRFHDIGYVPSVIKQRRKIDATYGCLGKENTYRGPIYSGEHAWREQRLPSGLIVIHNFIYYMEHAFLPSDIQTRAHEEGHVADFDKKLHLIDEKILDEERVRVNLGSVDGIGWSDEKRADVKADIVGIFAVENRGFHPSVLRGRPERPLDEYFDEALRIYDAGRLPERFFSFPLKPVMGLEQRLAA